MSAQDMSSCTRVLSEVTQRVAAQKAQHPDEGPVIVPAGQEFEM